MRGRPSAAITAQMGTLRLAVLAVSLSHHDTPFILRERHASSQQWRIWTLEQMSNAGEKACMSYVSNYVSTVEAVEDGESFYSVPSTLLPTMHSRLVLL